jgi:hypothetical protein
MGRALYYIFCVFVAILFGFFAAGFADEYAPIIIAYVAYKLIAPADFGLAPNDVRNLSMLIAIGAGLWTGVLVFQFLSGKRSKPLAATYNVQSSASRVGGFEGSVEGLFQARDGIVMQLKDARVLAPVGGRYELFASLQDYRRFAKDEDHWREIGDILEKRKILAEMPALLKGAEKSD